MKITILVIAVWISMVGLWPFADTGHSDLSSPAVMIDILFHVIGIAIVFVWTYNTFYRTNIKRIFTSDLTRGSFNAKYTVENPTVNNGCKKWTAWTYGLNHETLWTWACSCGLSALDNTDYKSLLTSNACIEDSAELHREKLVNGNS